MSFRISYCFFKTYFSIVSALSANLCCVTGNMNCPPEPCNVPHRILREEKAGVWQSTTGKEKLTNLWWHREKKFEKKLKWKECYSRNEKNKISVWGNMFWGWRRDRKVRPDLRRCLWAGDWCSKEKWDKLEWKRKTGRHIKLGKKYVLQQKEINKILHENNFTKTWEIFKQEKKWEKLDTKVREGWKKTKCLSLKRK